MHEGLDRDRVGFAKEVVKELVVGEVYSAGRLVLAPESLADHFYDHGRDGQTLRGRPLSGGILGAPVAINQVDHSHPITFSSDLGFSLELDEELEFTEEVEFEMEE